MIAQVNDVCSCEEVRFDKIRDRYFCNKYAMTPLAIAYHECGIRSPIMCNACLADNGKLKPRLERIVKIEQPLKSPKWDIEQPTGEEGV